MSITSDFRTLVSAQDDTSLETLNRAIQAVVKESPRTVYSKLRNQREQATFNLMMRMDPKALESIRHEFYCHEDSVCLNEFIYIMSKHLLDHSVQHGENLQAQSNEHREFGSYMYELFKEVDVNGDGQMEWEEFTKFTVEKASLLNQKFVLTSIPEYSESSHLIDPNVRMHRRNYISKMMYLQGMGNFAVIEEHKKALCLYNTYTGSHVSTIVTEAVPVAMEHVKDHSILLLSLANNTLNTIHLDVPQKKYHVQQMWPTPHTMMSIAWMKSSELVYSGANNGKVYSWKYSDKSLMSTMPGHTDIVMNLLALDKLDNLISASLDTAIGVWDTYTNSIIHKLRGHRKGVFGLSYNPDLRLLVSCGFDHDAFVWSPFVNSLVYKLKGHRASLVSCQSVEDSPEVITADEDGVFKVWDIRTFQCVQTFFHNTPSAENEPSETLTSFFHTKMTLKDKIRHYHEDLQTDSRIFGGSKGIICFDQKQVVHEKTTDFSNIIWLGLNSENCVVITVSDRNVLVWDMLMGSKLLMHNNICGEEISACCLDDRKRKIIIGDVNGKITVFNPLNGSFMKSCVHDVKSPVVSLQYIDDSRRFICGFMNGTLRLYDESKLDDCSVMRVFDKYNLHPELVSMIFCTADRTLVSAGSVGQPIKFWDYDTGKCEQDIECTDEYEAITAMCALNPYPLIATSDTTGHIVIWGSRASKWRGIKITSFMNTNPSDGEVEPERKIGENGTVLPSRVLPREDSDKEDDDDNDEQSHSTLNIKSESCAILDALEEKNSSETLQCIERWGPIAAPTCFAWDDTNKILYTADELGALRKFSLGQVINELGGQSMSYGVKIERVPPVRATSTTSTKTAQSTSLAKKKSVALMSVKFNWMILAHSESILYCACSKEGVMTSATDNLVKMWTFQGRPVGILLHSVPVGVRSQSWDLNLDIESIMRKEDEELDRILNEVKAVEESNDGQSKNFNTSMDEVTAQFSHSSLRKRIELSGKILGLDFYGNQSENLAIEESEENSLSLPGISEDMSLSEVSKTSRCALEELKDAYSTHKTKKKATTLLQDRRKGHDVEIMTKKFKEKGIKLPKLISDEPKFETPLPHDIRGKIKPYTLKPDNSKNSERNNIIDSKCSKYSAFDNLNALLDPNAPIVQPSKEDIARRKLKKQQNLSEIKDHFDQLEKNKLRAKSKKNMTSSMASSRGSTRESNNGQDINNEVEVEVDKKIPEDEEKRIDNIESEGEEVE